MLHKFINVNWPLKATFFRIFFCLGRSWALPVCERAVLKSLKAKENVICYMPEMFSSSLRRSFTNGSVADSARPWTATLFKETLFICQRGIFHLWNGASCCKLCGLAMVLSADIITMDGCVDAGPELYKSCCIARAWWLRGIFIERWISRLRCQGRGWPMMWPNPRAGWSVF